LVAPSNPVVSIGPILPCRACAALRRAPAPVVGFAGIVGGSPVLGMAHRLLPAIGVDVDAGAVGLHYGARSRGGVLDAWAMDTADASSAERVQQGGVRAVVSDLIMRDPRVRLLVTTRSSPPRHDAGAGATIRCCSGVVRDHDLRPWRNREVKPAPILQPRSSRRWTQILEAAPRRDIVVVT
jgi:2-phospho-L-lactate transferase/gluconeogenesis factor (CofD/UPF0052 family)